MASAWLEHGQAAVLAEELRKLGIAGRRRAAGNDVIGDSAHSEDVQREPVTGTPLPLGREVGGRSQARQGRHSRGSKSPTFRCSTGIAAGRGLPVGDLNGEAALCGRGPRRTAD